MKIAVVGTGYVGLTTGVCFASMGHDVWCLDNDLEKIRRLRNGSPHIHEPGLVDLFNKAINEGRLNFSSDSHEVITPSEFIFLCLPTPSLVTGEADIGALTQFVKANADLFSSGSILVNKSTAPISTTRLLSDLVHEKGVDVVANPEFLREGHAINDFLHPDRVVIGCQSVAAGQRVKSVYAPMQARTIVTSWESAETIKYMANGFLALKLTFINQVAGFCESVSADVREVINGLTLDKRIGEHFMQPGPGWGGSCFPKDTKSLVYMGRKTGFPMTLMESVSHENERHIDRLISVICDRVKLLGLDNARLGVLGLSFKADTDDVRESPAVRICRGLTRSSIQLQIYDPFASEVPDLEKYRVQSIDQALLGSDALVVATEWPEFTQLSPDFCRQHMRGRTIFDLRYLLDRNRFRDSEFSLYSYGVPDEM